jgi:hypothetical protein
MKSIPQDIIGIFSKRMETACIPLEDRLNYLQWLRFYLDFCEKYDHPPDDPESTAAFMQKLKEKRQSPARRRQAAKSVRVYLDIIKRKNSYRDLGSDRSSIDFQIADDNVWDAVFQNLRVTIRLRNYSRKTYTKQTTTIQPASSRRAKSNFLSIK